MKEEGEEEDKRQSLLHLASLVDIKSLESVPSLSARETLWLSNTEEREEQRERCVCQREKEECVGVKERERESEWFSSSYKGPNPTRV